MKKWEYNVFSECMNSAADVRQRIKSEAGQNWELVSVFPNPYLPSKVFPFMFVFRREILEPPLPKKSRTPRRKQRHDFLAGHGG